MDRLWFRSEANSCLGVRRRLWQDPIKAVWRLFQWCWDWLRLREISISWNRSKTQHLSLDGETKPLSYCWGLLPMRRNYHSWQFYSIVCFVLPRGIQQDIGKILKKQSRMRIHDLDKSWRPQPEEIWKGRILRAITFVDDSSWCNQRRKLGSD